MSDKYRARRFKPSIDGFYLGSVAYMAVYIKNHRSWAKAEK